MGKIDNYVKTIGKLTSNSGKQRGKLTLDQLQSQMGEQFTEFKRVPKVVKNEDSVKRPGSKEQATVA